MSMLFKRIKDWAVSITSFRTGDVIPVDGPSGTAKIGYSDLAKEVIKDSANNTAATESDLVSGSKIPIMTAGGPKALPGNTIAKASEQTALTTYAQNVAASIAPPFDPTRDSEHAYPDGYSVTYTDGKVYTFTAPHYGAWTGTDVRETNISELLDKLYSREAVTWEDGKYIAYSNGNKNSGTGVSASNKIDVSYASKLMLYVFADEDERGLAFYDGVGNYVSGVQYPDTSAMTTIYVDVPIGAKYVAFTTKTTNKDDSFLSVLDFSSAVRKLYANSVDYENFVNITLFANKLTVTWEDGKYIAYSNGKKNSGTGVSASNKIDVSYASKIRVYAKPASSADQRGLAFYDENSVYVSGYQYTGSTGMITVDVDVPIGAKYVAFTTGTDYKDLTYLMVVSIVGSVAKVKSQVDSFDEKLQKTLAYSRTLVWEDGKYIAYSNGAKNSANNYSCVEKVVVTGYKKLAINVLLISNSGSSGCAFYDINGRYISGVQYDSSESDVMHEYELTVPSGACYFSFTCRTSAKSKSYLYLYGVNDAVENINKQVNDILISPRKVPLSMFCNFAVCGDSYTAGQINSAQGVYDVYPKVSWGKVLERMTGVPCTIYANPGMTTKTYRTHANCLPKLLSETAKDLYLINLAINDSSSIDLGSLSDIDDEDPDNNADTYYGNYGYIIAKIKEHAPNAKVVLLKPWLTVTLQGNVNEVYSYASTAIEEIADHFNVLFGETMTCNYFNSVTFVTGRKWGHPTAPLYAGMANAVDDILSRLFFDSYEYLNDYKPV